MRERSDATALLAEIEEVGLDGDGRGYRRPVFSPAELELRTWFQSRAADRGLALETDGNGIMWAWWDLTGHDDGRPDHRREGAIVTGSHLDSVPGGGNLDGPLGVASALAAVDLLRERGIRPRRPLAIAVFPEEEGSRFGLACLGSRLLTGVASAQRVRELTDEDGDTYRDVAATAGFDPDLIGPDPSRLSRMSAFIELHVEQGRGLVDLGHAVGLARAIIAHGRWHLRIDGRSNHAGATRMADRQDPVVVAAEAIRSLREHTLAVEDARGTIGRVTVSPGGTNVIAASIDLWIDVRHRSESTVRKIVDDVAAATVRAAENEGCTLTLTEQSFSPTVSFDSRLLAVLKTLLPSAPVLDTGAGHDAGILAPAVPSGMIFVRNPTGASHTPDESADAADIAAGVEALAHILEFLLTR